MKSLKYALIVLAIPALAQAAIVATPLGTGAPPAILGGYNMQAFGPDGQGFGGVNSVATPIGGTINFSQVLTHTVTPGGWSTWSHGYNGDVYFGGPSATTVTMPVNTGAFILYAEPDPFQVINITATADDGTFITQAVNGQGGASGYGFHATGGMSISSITVSMNGTDVYAIGEFSIARVPEPATLSLLALGGLAALRRRK